MPSVALSGCEKATSYTCVQGYLAQQGFAVKTLEIDLTPVKDHHRAIGIVLL